jgi:uncharacterized protein
MTQAAKVQEPSMEEILASIRRIISDDDATKSTKLSAPMPEPKPSTIASIASRPRQFPPRPSAPTPTSRLDAKDNRDADARSADPDVSADLSMPEVQASPDGLLSRKTRTVIDNAFKSLAGTVNEQKPSTSLEDLVKETLRPMLKLWLDDNLPGLVESIVRAEIERISRMR